MVADWLTGMSDQSLGWSDIGQITFEKLFSPLNLSIHFRDMHLQSSSYFLQKPVDKITPCVGNPYIKVSSPWRK